MISKKGELVKSKCSRMDEWRKNNPDKVKKYRKTWKAKNADRVRSYQEEWREKNPGYNKKWMKKNPDYLKERDGCNPEYSKKARQKQPHVHRVAKLVYHAIRRGEIFKPEICERCKEEKRILAHHEDYNKPFEIIWLCYSCHKIIHYEKRRMEMDKDSLIRFYLKTSLFEKIKYYISKLRGKG